MTYYQRMLLLQELERSLALWTKLRDTTKNYEDFAVCSVTIDKICAEVKYITDYKREAV